MRNILRGLTFLLIPIIVTGFLRYFRQSKQAEENTVYLPKLFAILGAISSAIFLIPALITVFSDGSLWKPIPFLLLSLLGAALIIAFVNCRISYDEEGFVSKNFFGVKRKFTYQQVTAIKENMFEKFIYIGKRRILVDQFSIGGDTFIKLVKRKYRTMHDGQSLPKIHKTKHDIFKGNVKDTGGFLFTYILIGVLVIGLLIFAIHLTYFTTSTPRNTIKQSVHFVSCTTKEEEIVLTSANHQIYIIQFIDKQFDVKDIQDLCDGNKLVTIYSKEITPADGENYYLAKAIAYNNNYVLSFDETNKLHRQEYTLLVIVAVVMCFAWGALVSFSIIIGRNPKKFSKRLIKLFFKDGYINY